MMICPDSAKVELECSCVDAAISEIRQDFDDQ